VIEQSQIDDPAERARIMLEFERLLTVPTGFVPIQPANAPASRARWFSEIWPLRRPASVPDSGDSSIGWRLPLDSYPSAASEQPVIMPADPLHAARQLCIRISCSGARSLRRADADEKG
jgi:uncharacterized protein (DUF2126 family)